MRILLVALVATYCAAAAAQLRTIPKEAQVGTMRHVEAMVVELDGQQQKLAPGAQIRDPDNRVVLPVSLKASETVRYLRDVTGAVSRVWILSATEKDALPPPPSPFPK